MHKLEEFLQCMIDIHLEVLRKIINLSPSGVLAITFEGQEELDLFKAELEELLSVLPTVVLETKPSAGAHY